jgi:hypothetical protein
LCRRRSEEPYQKGENEDLESIITGIRQQKGLVHLAFCEPISREELESIGEQPKQDWCPQIARLIDERIRQEYHLFDTNYIAHDILHNERRYAEHYTPESEAHFRAHLATAEMAFEQRAIDVAVAREIFLGIYANPVDAKLN